MTLTRILAAWILIIAALLGPAQAQDNQSPPPEEVFRYVIFDAGDALEIDWAVNLGGFLYAEDMSYESGDPNVRLLTPELPAAENGLYDGNFFVRLPYELSGDRPVSIPLTIKIRGGVNGGDDYSPQTWIETT